VAVCHRQAVELLGEGDSHIIGDLPSLKGIGLTTMFIGDGANDIGALQVRLGLNASFLGPIFVCFVYELFMTARSTSELAKVCIRVGKMQSARHLATRFYASTPSEAGHFHTFGYTYIAVISFAGICGLLSCRSLRVLSAPHKVTRAYAPVCRGIIRKLHSLHMTRRFAGHPTIFCLMSNVICNFLIS
jgi:hypothetical protein